LVRQAILLVILGLLGSGTLQAETPEDAVARAVAGIDFSRPRTSQDIPDPSQAGRDNSARELANIERANRRAATSYWQYGKDILRTSALGYLIQHLTSAASKGDPAFTTQQFITRFTSAQQELPAEWWPMLSGAASQEHFDKLLLRARQNFRASQRLQEANWEVRLASWLFPVVLVSGLLAATLHAVSARAKQAPPAKSESKVSPKSLNWAKFRDDVPGYLIIALVIASCLIYFWAGGSGGDYTRHWRGAW
jgi:hypothetical protein